MEYSPTKIKSLLERHNFNLKKMYGQNFIIDENTINNIVNKALIDNDTLVIEIGPGAGSLTYKLCQVAKYVLCYEIDTKLKEILEDNLKEFNNYSIIFDDFLNRNIKEDLKNYNYSKLYVVANLPYYITTPIIVKLIEDHIDVSKMVIMVQKEVGDRFRASCGSKNYNSLSVFLNYYYDVKKILDVSKNVFMPVPNVDSVVLELDKKQDKYIVKNEDLFFKLIKDSFKQKRKNLKNNLKEYDLKTISDILFKYNYDLNVRAEQLSIEIFVDIANNIGDK